MKDWWLGLAPRERRLLGGGGLLALLMLGYGLVWAPLQDARNDWQRRAEAAEASLQWMRVAVERLAQQPLRAAPVADGRSLLARIDEGARQAGLGPVLLRVEPLAAGRVRAHFQAAPFDQLMDWLQPLARDHGVRVEELSLQRAAGVGLVDARLTLVQPGAK
jgi:general secretion pathway protein M